MPKVGLASPCGQVPSWLAPEHLASAPSKFLITADAEYLVKHSMSLSGQRCREMVLGILRVVVSGVGIRLGNQYVFPEMIPVAVAYLWQ